MAGRPLRRARLAARNNPKKRRYGVTVIGESLTFAEAVTADSPEEAVRLAEQQNPGAQVVNPVLLPEGPAMIGFGWSLPLKKNPAPKGAPWPYRQGYDLYEDEGLTLPEVLRAVKHHKKKLNRRIGSRTELARFLREEGFTAAESRDAMVVASIAHFGDPAKHAEFMKGLRVAEKHRAQLARR